MIELLGELLTAFLGTLVVSGIGKMLGYDLLDCEDILVITAMVFITRILMFT